MQKILRKEYAKAIYEIAREENKIQDFLDLSLAITDAFTNEPKVQEYLSSPTISHIEKKEFINEIIDSNFNLYINWLSIIIDDKKSKYIKDYIDEFIKIYNNENNIVKGYVWTTELIDKELIKRIEEKISKKLNKKVMFENQIDKNLIGGIKLQVEDDIWDNSIKNKLIQVLNKGSEKNE